MNFASQFADAWTLRFGSDLQSPNMDCLKADQFNSLFEQKRALESEENRVCRVIEDLTQRLTRENFLVDYLRKCIHKLGAVSLVFSEIDQHDSKVKPSSGTNTRQTVVSPSRTDSSNGSPPQAATTYSSNLPILSTTPTSFIQSVSPLLIATSSATTFLLPPSIPTIPDSGYLKLDPDTPASDSSSVFPVPDYILRPEHTCPTKLTHPLHQTSLPCNSLTSCMQNLHNNTNNTAPISTTSDGARITNGITQVLGPSGSNAHVAAAMAAALALKFPPAMPVDDSIPATESQLMTNGDPTSRTTRDHLTNSTLDDREDRRHRCSICSRSFTAKAGLTQHIRTHTDERPYPCHHCGRAFKQKVQLTTHLRVHSDERPYGCRLCGKLFRQQSHVVQHLKTHTGERPHKCCYCGKAFCQKYNLISHQRRMCRTRSTGRPLVPGMTVWISPGVGGQSGNIVKEFSPPAKPINLPPHATSTPESITGHSSLVPSFFPSPVTASSSFQTHPIFPTAAGQFKNSKCDTNPLSASTVKRQNQRDLYEQQQEVTIALFPSNNSHLSHSSSRVPLPPNDNLCNPRQRPAALGN